MNRRRPTPTQLSAFVFAIFVVGFLLASALIDPGGAVYP